MVVEFFQAVGFVAFWVAAVILGILAAYLVAVVVVWAMALIGIGAMCLLDAADTAARRVRRWWRSR